LAIAVTSTFLVEKPWMWTMSAAGTSRQRSSSIRRTARAFDSRDRTSTRMRVTGTPSTSSCLGSAGSTEVVSTRTSARSRRRRAMFRHCSPPLLISG
jgi:hypothetical protein